MVLLSTLAFWRHRWVGIGVDVGDVGDSIILILSCARSRGSAGGQPLRGARPRKFEEVSTGQ